jgi:hypothetical protein
MLTTNGRNQLLDATDIAFASLHDDYPGQTQAHELTGGSPAYARKGVTFASAASGSKASSNAQVFDVPGGSTVRWIGGSTASTAGSGRYVSPNGGAPKEFQVDLTNNKILCEGHGYSANQKIVFYGGTPPGGLTEGTIYFVINPTSADPDTFQVSATSGGSAIDITSQHASDCVVSVIVEESFGAQGTFTVPSGSFTLALNN